MSNKTWETITQHAKSCVLDNKRYMYHTSGRQVGLIFDSVYNLVGATFNGQNYEPLGNLTASQMVSLFISNLFEYSVYISKQECPLKVVYSVY